MTVTGRVIGTETRTVSESLCFNKTYTVPWFRWLFARISACKIGFDPRPFLVGFIDKKSENGTKLPLEISDFLCQYHFTNAP